MRCKEFTFKYSNDQWIRNNCFLKDRDEFPAECTSFDPYVTSGNPKNTGCYKAIARTAKFENISFAVIASNVLWVSVKMDNKKATVLTNADAVVQVVHLLVLLLLLH